MASRETLERIAENQSRFREANERIEQTADSMHLVGPIPFVCECPTPACTDLVRMTMSEYEGIRANERRFFVVPGHEEASVSNNAGVVAGEAEDARYVLVDKIGLAGEIAAERYRDLAD
jgi:hypothetical protein